MTNFYTFQGRILRYIMLMKPEIMDGEGCWEEPIRCRAFWNPLCVALLLYDEVLVVYSLKSTT
jgi:hypothetical protein